MTESFSVYLVGGAVRDKLLGEPVSERDWVVVGATPEQLLRLDYVQVGRDFPVFLHPKTKEEYALARTERKTASGHHGFKCDASPDVTLIDDLKRRDLTINAIASDGKGNLIDPYGGKDDISNRLLRHVSPAFTEDPLRVLRVARFAARFHDKGFRVADETMQLMQVMAEDDDLLSLTPERVWQEWLKSLKTNHPEVFFEVLLETKAFEALFPELELSQVKAANQSLARVAKVSTEPKVRFAAWMRYFDGIENFCQKHRVPKAYIQMALMAKAFDALEDNGLSDAEHAANVLERMDAYRKPERFLDLLTACEVCTISSELWQSVLKAASEVAVEPLVAAGHHGKAMKEALHDARISLINKVINKK